MKKQQKKKWRVNKQWTANKIGNEGASNISESLKINTTLTKLNLNGDEIRNKKGKTQKKNEE